MAEAPPFPRTAPLAAEPLTEGSAAPPPLRPAGWLPALAVTGCVGAVLGYHGVAFADLAVFTVYAGLGLTLPGVLWVRVLYRRPHTLPEELALGLALGYAAEILCYLPARATGMPLLVAAWPMGTYAIFAAVPRLRAHCRRTRRARAPLWWSWCLALGVICLTLWIGTGYFADHPVALPPAAALPHLDMVARLMSHGPDGGPFGHDWFVHAHLAAASWITGVAPSVLLLRLAAPPMLAALVVLLAMAGRRFTGSRRQALAALAAAVFVAAPVLYTGDAAGVLAWTPPQEWATPAQTFGALLFAPLVVLLLDLFGDRPPGRGAWLVFAVLLAALAGAKAVYVPLLAAGLLAVVVVETVKWLAPPRRAVAALGLTACALAAQAALLGDAWQETAVRPLEFARASWAGLTGAADTAEAPMASLAGVAALGLLCGAITWSGVLGLVRRPRLLGRPPVVLALGMGAAGLGAVLLLGDPYLAQGDYLQAACPYLAMAAVHGLGCVARRAHVTFPAGLCAVLAGVAAACAVRWVFAVHVPLRPGAGELALYLPYLTLAGVVLAAGALLAATGQPRARVLALTLLLVTAAGTPAAWLGRALPVASPAVTAPAQPAGPGEVSGPAAGT
ncbi:hypothetical protein GCM10010149_04850 [Nonomuraea roseoviolacea subsp. roseoviolacea]|uniref:hypothetical protein n=1 Tax=Nonomuraea roseoviolacea TaxID=103837 RepID=UPI0031E20599